MSLSSGELITALWVALLAISGMAYSHAEGQRIGHQNAKADAAEALQQKLDKRYEEGKRYALDLVNALSANREFGQCIAEKIKE